MICKNCGNEISKTSNFCPNCGIQLTDLIAEEREIKQMTVTCPICGKPEHVITFPYVKGTYRFGCPEDPEARTIIEVKRDGTMDISTTLDDF